MKKLFLLALSIASLSACKKDSENIPSKTELLTNKNWRVTAFSVTTTYSPAGGTPSSGTIDQYAQQLACEKDNFYKFNVDKTMVLDEGPNKCSTSPNQTTAFTWDFNSDQTKLLVTAKGASSTTPDDIVELSASTMRLRETSTTSSNGSTTTREINITFTSF